MNMQVLPANVSEEHRAPSADLRNGCLPRNQRLLTRLDSFFLTEIALKRHEGERSSPCVA